MNISDFFNWPRTLACRMLPRNMFGLVGKTLAVDKLQPGDIILSGSFSRASLFLQLATGSIFSHAALVIHPLLWFESVPDGIQYKAIECRLGLDNGRLRCVTTVAPGHWMSVIRLKSEILPTIDSFVLLKSLLDISLDHFSLQYPNKEKFLKPIKMGIGRTKIAYKIAAQLSRKEHVFFPGVFCSALIVIFFKKVGIELFPNIAEDAITPGAISRSKKFGIANASCAISNDLPTAFRSLDIEAQANARSSNFLIKNAMDAALSGTVNTLLADRTAQLLEVAELLTPDHEQKASIAREIIIQKQRISELSDEFHTNRKKLNPVRIQLISLLAWWEAYKCATECMPACKGAISKYYECGEDGCSRSSEAHLKFLRHPPKSLRSIFADREQYLAEDTGPSA